MLGAVTTVMVDTHDLESTARFWQELLGLELVHRTDTYIYLSPMSEGGPHLAFQLVDDPHEEKNRYHLDVRVEDRAAAIQQIEAAGGTRIGDVAEPGFPVWTVMKDPAGNQFCIYEAATG